MSGNFFCLKNPQKYLCEKCNFKANIKSRWENHIQTELHKTGQKKTRGQFREDLLFTHRGLSGPAVLQISSYWQQGTALMLNLLPGHDIAQALIEGKQSIRKNLGNWLAQYLPNRLAEGWLIANQFQPDARLADVPDKKLRQLGESLNRWTLTPNGSEGYKKAEVTLGGVDT